MGTDAQKLALAVDDSPEILFMLKQVLEHHGYQVITASDGKEALDLVRSKGPIDLMVTDQEMPNFCGTDLVRKILKEGLSVAWIAVFTGLPPDSFELTRFQGEVRAMGLDHVKLFFKGGDSAALETFISSI